ncbi:MAG TPA: enoyl-CoA hydratase, partial [Acidobacteriota bacterium]|nr:enoyl-CoA hydratase [Acidobacteriota bacterium]
MSETYIRIDASRDIATITIARPDKRNALTDPMRAALLRTVTAAAADPRTRAVVLTGGGRAFCAGGDIAVLADLKRRGNEAEFERLLDEGREIVRLLRTMPKPTIAMVNGPAYGAGCFLAIACDLRLCGESASFGVPLVKLGLGPEWGGTFLLPRLIGPARTLEMLYTGEPIDAHEALRLGLANRVWPDAELAAHTQAFVARLLEKPPAVLSRLKQAVGATMDLSYDETAVLERRRQMENFASPDCAEGIAAFLEKRPAR